MDTEKNAKEVSLRIPIFLKFAGMCGMASQIVYILMWIIGGGMQAGYNHFRDDVSTLLAVGAPNRLLLTSMNISTGLLSCIFAIGLLVHFKQQEYSILGPICFMLYGITYVILASFVPLGEGGEKESFQAQLHLLLVILLVVFTILAALALWQGLRRVSAWEGYDRFSLVTVFAAIIFGAIGAYLSTINLMGLGERLGSFPVQLFIFVTAFKLYRENR